MGQDPEEAVGSRECFILFSVGEKKPMKENDLEKRRKWMVQEKGKLLEGYVFERTRCRAEMEGWP